MILVTGASGLLGASVIAAAVERAHKVVGLYHQHPVCISRVLVSQVDLTNRAEVQRCFEEHRPTAVIHCAAQTNVDWCQEHPQEAHQVNTLASGTLAEIAARYGTYFLYVSTDAVFDGNREAYAETDEPHPLSVYAQSKLEGERTVLERHDSAAVARVTLYGWNVQHKQSLSEWIFDKLQAGKPVPGFTDVIFCPILANDVADVLLAMTEQKLTGIFHVVGSEAVSKFEFARTLAQTFGFSPGQVIPTRIADSRLRAPRPLKLALNTEKISRALGRPMPDVGSGLQRFARLRAEGYVARMRQQLTEVDE